MNIPEIRIVINKDLPGGVSAIVDSGGAGVEWDPTTGVSGATAGIVAFMALDVFSLHLVFDDPESDTDFLFDADCVVSCSLAATSELSDDNGVVELVRVTPFTRDGANYDYYADMDLNKTAIITALGVSDSLACVLDVRVEKDAARVSYRVPVTVYRPAIGEQGDDDPVATTWANVAGAQMRQRADGLIEFYDFTRAKWVAPVVRDGVLEFQEDA